MEKLKSVIAKQIIKFDYTEAINEMIQDGEIKTEEDIEQNVLKWFADDVGYYKSYNVDVKIKP